MREPPVKGTTTGAVQRSQIERAKSLRDIDNQYSRIDNRLYQQYINYEIDEDTFNSRRRQIQNAYDRYQTNIVRNQGAAGWRRGMSYPGNVSEWYGSPVSRNIYARNNR